MFTPQGGEHTTSTKNKKLTIIIGVVVGVVVLAILLIILIILLIKRSNQRDASINEEFETSHRSALSKIFYFPSTAENQPVELNTEEVVDAFDFVMNEPEDGLSE